MKELITVHPMLAITLATLPLLVVIVIVWRSRPSIRLAAVMLGLLWTIVVTTYFAFQAAEAGEFLDRKNFIFLPVDKIIENISSTADSGDLQLTKAKLGKFQMHWNTICMTTNDPWVIFNTIENLKPKSELEK